MLQPTRSRYLVGWIIVTQLLALLGILQLQVNAMTKLVMGLLLVLYLNWLVFRHLLAYSRYSVTQAILTEAGVWNLRLGNGREIQANLSANSFVKPWLIVLRFKTTQSRLARHLVVFPDTLDKQLARRLRVYLRRYSELAR
jgi:hypothetical protein